MVLNPANGLLVKWRAIGRFTKLAIIAEASGAPGNLTCLCGCQRAATMAVIFEPGGKCDTVDIEVKPHTDRVSGNEVVHFPGLIESNLCIAGSRTKRAHDNCCATFLPAQKLGNRVDVICGKRDDGRSLWQLGELHSPAIRQLGKTLAGIGLELQSEIVEHAAHSV